MKPRLAILLAILLIATGAGIFIWQHPQTQQQFEQQVQNAVDQTSQLIPMSPVIATPPPLRGPSQATNNQLTASGTFTETNNQRAQNGVAPLTRNAILDKAAKAKLDDMFAKQYFEHVSPDGTTPSDVVEHAGYTFLTAGENLALGNFGSDAALLEAWMNSPGHRANILNKGYQEIGIAVGQGTFEGQTTWLAVQEFGTPASACPLPDKTLKSTIDDANATTAALQNELDQQKSAIDQQSVTIQKLSDDAKNLANQGNQKIEDGNAQIQKGNEVYQETGDKKQAQPYWDKGAALQAEGQDLISQANQKVAAAKAAQTQLENLQAAYNSLIDKYNSLVNQTKSQVSQYNTQVGAYNTCIGKLQ